MSDELAEGHRRIFRQLVGTELTGFNIEARAEWRCRDQPHTLFENAIQQWQPTELFNSRIAAMQFTADFFDKVFINLRVLSQ